ncbi:Sterile alpha motif domain-containing protein 11 [Orchesella cincta]|uniref:Sterile alpha motif domain-containing protein 11 n=1 Tax=Orchesella cincta TaxID=48709 RepID=A0A1D2NE67_ORCCI|nr:Sterile alpha motif domain-containing protein 11 [Orchesella cincta]
MIYFPNLSFDTRFLKPAAAAAFLNLSQLPSPVLLEKDKFPLIDMSSTQTLLSMVRSASAAAAAAAVTNNNNINNNNNNHPASNECFKSGGTKRPNSPLDLSSRDSIPLKKTKLKTPIDLMLSAKQGSGGTAVCMSSCATGCSEEAQAMINWNVEEVCQFVATIDLCKDYVEVFRENSIDGTALPLLSEEHLMTAMNMKLGPALKFRSTVAKRLGNCVICSHCTHCHNHNNN